MKKSLVVLIFPVLFAFTSLSPTAEVTPPAKGKAVVYIARTSIMGLLFSFSYYDKDKFIGRFSKSGFIRYECEPGEHVFWAKSPENRDFCTAELEADKIYFLRAEPKTFGSFTTRVELKPISPKDQEKRVIEIINMINKKEETVNTPEEIEKESNRKEEIEKALKSFDELTAKGSKIDRLTKDMFYVPAAK